MNSPDYATSDFSRRAVDGRDLKYHIHTMARYHKQSFGFVSATARCTLEHSRCHFTKQGYRQHTRQFAGMRRIVFGCSRFVCQMGAGMVGG